MLKIPAIRNGNTAPTAYGHHTARRTVWHTVRRTAAALLACLLLLLCLWSGGAGAVYAEEADSTVTAEEETGNAASAEEVAAIVDSMTLEEKVAQMLIPSIREWEGTPVTDLADAPALSKALQKHPYGGLILFDSNINDPAQTAALTAALQENNARGGDKAIPYFMTVDAEGGLVMRLTGGTRMPGNMAIGAAGTTETMALGTPGAPGRYDAYAAGLVIGEELSALGFNVDFAPDIDINNDPANPVIGVRSFGDDPEAVALLGTCYGNGLRKSGVIATYKHFPGHGDTDVDSHFGLPQVGKTYEELQETELIPFKAAAENGADMIMTAHITFPAIDEEVTFADGSTGYYPATMSRTIITDILRGDLGYEGVIVSDGLEMDAIAAGGLVPGSGLEYDLNVAEKVINAGVDMLLIPRDLNDQDAADFYDAYIAGIAERVNSGAIEESLIDASVTRILTVKQKYGLLDQPAAEEADANEEADTSDDSESGISAVGSDTHRTIEKQIALHGVTLVKNDETLPLDAPQNVVIFGRSEAEKAAIDAAVAALREGGAIPEEATITTGTYYDSAAETYAPDEACLAAAQQADAAIVFTTTTGLSSLHDMSTQSQAAAAMQAALPKGGKLIIVSGDLPYDAARYQQADAILLAYMGAGLDQDPTGNKTDTAAGSNANTAAALDIIFGAASPQGMLPVNIPAVEAQGDGSYVYSDEILYERGFGLTY